MSVPANTVARIRALILEAAIKERPLRENRKDLPLIAWLQAAPKSIPSRVMYLTQANPKFPFRTFLGGTTYLTHRIQERYDLTWIQTQLLYEWMSQIYRYRYDGFSWCTEYFGEYSSLVQPFCDITQKPLLWEIFDLQRSLKERKKIRSYVPLGFILDPRLKNLILLHQLERTVMQKRAKPHLFKERNKVWMQIN